VTCLLDTCAWLGFSSDQARALGKSAMKLMTNKDNQIAYSPIVCLEMEYLRSKNRTVFSGSAAELVARVAVVEKWTCWPFNDLAVSFVPELFQHGISDPFDVMIAATALAHNATIITCDRRLAALRILKTVW
jgi:PIN domain nuclease of toxin-antitoxin system